MENFQITGNGILPSYRIENIAGSENIKLYFNYEKAVIPDKFTVSWFEENEDTYAFWFPLHFDQRAAMPSWRIGPPRESRSNFGMPLYQYTDKCGNNIFTVALSDAVTPVYFRCGIDERSGKLQIRIDFFTQPVKITDKYEVTVYRNTEKIPYYKAIKSAVDFLYERYPEAYVPDAAKRRTFSSWYCFQKDIDEERFFRQCVLAKDYGMDTVILDDGWQTPETTSDSNPYITAGDWEPFTGKFADMAAFSDRIHAIGSKLILWFATPFIGINSKYYDIFKGRTLYANRADQTVLVADPRYADIRQWYADIFSDRVKNWKLDGLKIDFIDNFRYTDETPAANEKMDIPDLAEAVYELLKGIYSAVKKINPEIIIEFRQSYIGPSLRQFGNIIRVDDCAYGAMYNRENGADLRLITKNTAIHSDMLMWDSKASVEAAADQLSALLFIVPQISMLLDELPENHAKMLKFYLDYIDNERDILQNGNFVPLYPEAKYPVIYAEKNNEVIAALYCANSFSAPEKTERLHIVNAAGNKKTLVDFSDSNLIGKKYSIVNCMGEKISEGTINNNVAAFEIPHNGIFMTEK